MAKQQPTINSLERGIDLLELIAQRGSVKLAELPELLDTSRATAFRILRTLQQRGYVVHNKPQHSYRLGAGPAILAVQSRASSLSRLAGPAMAELRDVSGETVNLGLFRAGGLVYVEIVEGRHALRMSGTVGEEAPLHATALGKAVLATLTEETRRELLGAEPYEAQTANTCTTFADLEREISATIERGYAIEMEETDLGATCIAAPILGSAGNPVGAISVSGPASRFDLENVKEIGALLVRRCADISRELGHEGDTQS